MAEAVEEGEAGYLNICNELDNLAIRILNVMRNIMLERQYLDGNLKDGFINIAKSRYLMRGQKISKHQINTSNLIASKKVSSSDNTINGVKFTSFHIHKKKFSSVSEEVPSKFVSSDENCDRESSSRNEKNSLSTVENPLHWFGLLVPDALKSSQSRFEQALETSVKIVSLQNELKALCESYRNLKQKKHAALA